VFLIIASPRLASNQINPQHFTMISDIFIVVRNDEDAPPTMEQPRDPGKRENYLVRRRLFLKHRIGVRDN
jgi:hypothetical protein